MASAVLAYQVYDNFRYITIKAAVSILILIQINSVNREKVTKKQETNEYIHYYPNYEARAGRKLCVVSSSSTHLSANKNVRKNQQ